MVNQYSILKQYAASSRRYMSEYQAVFQAMVRSRSIKAIQLDCLEALESAIQNDVNLIILAAQQCTDNDFRRLCLNYGVVFQFGIRELLIL